MTENELKQYIRDTVKQALEQQAQDFDAALCKLEARLMEQIERK